MDHGFMPVLDLVDCFTFKQIKEMSWTMQRYWISYDAHDKDPIRYCQVFLWVVAREYIHPTRNSKSDKVITNQKYLDMLQKRIAFLIDSM